MTSPVKPRLPLDRPLVVAGRLSRLLEARASEELARLHRLSPSVEALNVTRPKVVAAVHRRFLDAGADAILTNTAGAVPQLIDRDRIDHEAFPVTYMGATLAADVAAKASTPERPRWSIGDVTIPWRIPFAGFARPSLIEQTAHLLVSAQAAGGVDAVLLDLPHDPTPMTAAIAGARSGMAEARRSLPILVSLRYEAAPSRIHSGSIDGAMAHAAAVACGHGVRLARLSDDAPVVPGAIRLYLASEPRRVARLRGQTEEEDEVGDPVGGIPTGGTNLNLPPPTITPTRKIGR